jgi:hypothetical protein
MHRHCPDGIFPPMQRIPILLCVVALPAITLMVGCAGGGSQGGQAHTQQRHTARKLELRPEHGSGVSGTATFKDAKDAKDAIVVVLELRNLPKPETLYLAHIHPGTCAQEQEEEGESHGGHHEHGEDIEYPLSQVKSNSKGTASSTTMLRDTSVDKLFAGEPKHVNVHEAGAGNPPILTCADLEQAG